LAPDEYEPAAHALHVRSAVDEPAEATKLPAAQLVHAAHVAAFVVVEYVPAAHAVHVRSDVELGAVATRSPGSQSVHGVHDVAFVVVVYPLAHDAHVRSLVDEPAEAT
jgi:hypothetical protein